MLSWLTDWSGERAKAKELYGAVVAQARQPSFYAGLGVPDTPEGRYEMVVLHLFLLLERLRAGAPGATARLSRRILETFVIDMDDSMREMGVGDQSVPKKVKRAAAGFYERAGEYRAALAVADQVKLEDMLRARLAPSPDAAVPLAPDLLAYYVRSTAEKLAAQNTDDLRAGRVAFPSVVYADM